MEAPAREERWLLAPAKVNLTLEVVGRRADGYHELRTWMQKLELADELYLQVEIGQGVSCQCDDPALPVGGDNLAVRAAEAFLAASRRAVGRRVNIRLAKKIPVAAGLGGGSSDAGAVLRGLNSIFAEEFSSEQLVDLARPLGADVPFFALPDPAVYAEGIGDRMRPVPSLTGCWFVLVNPGFFVSTAWVFANLALTRRAKNSTVPCSELCRSFLPGGPFPLLHNDLEAVTGAVHPEIGEIKESLLAAGALVALMSGSGPTVFGIWPDEKAANSHDLQGIVDPLRRRYGEKVFVTRSRTGASPSGKAPGFGPGILRFES